MIDRFAVQDGSRAAGVVGHHAADRGAAGGRDIGRETQAVRLQMRVQFIQHDARLDAHPALGGIQFQNAVVIFRGVDLKAFADRLAGLRSASSAHRQRATKLAGRSRRCE